MIKNLIFDMGNVLLKYDPQVPLDAFCSSEEEKALIRRELFEGPEWVMGDKGLIKDEDRYELVKGRVPEEHWPALKRCCEQWFICMKPLPGAEAFLRYAKEKGCRIFILSNASNAFYWYFPDFMPLSFFDGIVVSADVRMLKPSREIYEYLIGKYQLDPKESLFLDDMPQNVEGARAVGLNAHCFDGDFDRVKSEYKL